MASNRQKH